MVRCPACGGAVDDRALSCRYCGCQLYDAHWQPYTERSRRTRTNGYREQPTYRINYTGQMRGDYPGQSEQRSGGNLMGALIVTLLAGILIFQILEVVLLLV